LDTIKVYATLDAFIFDLTNETWVENLKDRQLNIWRVVVNYTKSGTQAGNVLTFEVDNPNPSSSFSIIETFEMPSGASLQTFIATFAFQTVGSILSVPGLGDANAEGYNFTIKTDGGNNVTINAMSVLRVNGMVT